jgi:hypothetical protein
MRDLSNVNSTPQKSPANSLIHRSFVTRSDFSTAYWTRLVSLAGMARRSSRHGNALSEDVALPAVPLWRIAPGRDAEGRPVSDFLVLLPQLRGGDQGDRDWVAAQLRLAFGEFDSQVVFAELNSAIGTLWVTVQGRPGLCYEVATAIRRRLPQARLISALMQPPQPRGLVSSWWNWMPRIRARIPRPGARLRGPGRPDNGTR